MSGHHQPKTLAELAFTSFTTFMEKEALALIRLVLLPSSSMEVLQILIELGINCPSPSEVVTEISRKCIKLKHLFHATRLPESIANELTGHLLIKLDGIDISDIFDSYENAEIKKLRKLILSQITEVYMHPNVTEIKLVSAYSFDSECDQIPDCNFIGSQILTVSHKLHNLKALNLRAICDYHLQKGKLVLPSQLKELTLCKEPSIAGEGLRSVAESCPDLKTLKLTVTSEEGILHILKCKHLETLHVIGGPDGHLEQECVALINGISMDITSDVLSTSTIKSFGLTLTEEGTLRLLVNKLPMITEINLCLMHDFDLSSLTQLKNLRSLSLDILHKTSVEYKKILPDLGRNLVSLDLKHYYTLDIEFIGETCSNLKRLCLSAHRDVPPEPSPKMYPNFKTVQYLKVNMVFDFYWTKFIIMQCVNLKVLDVNLYENMKTVIENVLIRTPADSLEKIGWRTLNETNENFLLGLRWKHPNFRMYNIQYPMNFSYNSFGERVIMYFK